jgi:Tfp pilus assembly protein PilX
MKSHSAGSVLAISLVLLTAITLIAMMGMQRAGLQTKIAANIQHKENTFISAYTDLQKVYHDLQAGSSLEFSDAKRQGCSAISTDIAHKRLIEASTTACHINTGLEGKPNTSSLRDSNSRGKNGAGIESFEVESIATLPNNIHSDQKIRVNILLDQL